MRDIHADIHARIGDPERDIHADIPSECHAQKGVISLVIHDQRDRVREEEERSSERAVSKGKSNGPERRRRGYEGGGVAPLDAAPGIEVYPLLLAAGEALSRAASETRYLAFLVRCRRKQDPYTAGRGLTRAEFNAVTDALSGAFEALRLAREGLGSHDLDPVRAEVRTALAALAEIEVALDGVPI